MGRPSKRKLLQLTAIREEESHLAGCALVDVMFSKRRDLRFLRRTVTVLAILRAA